MGGNVQKMSSVYRRVLFFVVLLFLINVLLCVVVGFLRIHRTQSESSQRVMLVNQSLNDNDSPVLLPAKVMVDTYASWVNVVVYMILVSDGGQMSPVRNEGHWTLDI